MAGASGFLGRNLLLAAPEDWSIVATYHRSGDLPEFLEAHGLGRVRALRCDLSDPVATRTVAEEVSGPVDLCVFLAANTVVPLSVEEPLTDLLANTATLLNTLTSFEVGRLVFLSSGAVYDGHRGLVGPDTCLRPTLPYGVSKLASERYVEHAAGAGWIESYAVVRFFGAYGPFEPARKIFTRLATELGIERRSRFSIYGSGSNLVNAMYVDDAIRALMKVALARAPRATVDLASGTPLSVSELVQAAACLFLDGPVRIESSGVAHEAIEFWPRSETFEQTYEFTTAVTLEDGLRRLRDHLARPGQRRTA